ncbi:MAG: uroporphyrinogen-III C-methyltransferase [Leptolyngbyaceae cyanobacterium bins.349]|nr:uroporphyrinogen-III C-methyltransferase [Leptolyngbyaceae cyanobacterium bins.349]
MAEYVGKVYLVGSGPGDAAYLTLQAREILAQAEVLVYDALVDGDLIDLVPDTCLKLDVGKRGGQPSTPQSEINRLIVDHCQQGKQVVRLKNGDPFIFGRAQSEIGALRQANCDFEIIPGLSSALVAPLMAGIPLTDPQLSRGFTVVTAHDPDALNWVSLAKLDTLVLLMGGRTLPEIVRRLRGHGRSPATPVAIIRYAGRPEQQIWDGTLSTILDRTAGESLAPCVIVIGEVVKLRAYVGEQGAAGKKKQEASRQRAERKHTTQETGGEGREGQEARDSRADGAETFIPSLASPASPSAPPLPTVPSHAPTDSTPPPHSLPLAHKTVLVTRATSQSSQFAELLQAQGAQVVEMPTLEIGPPSSWRDLDRAIARIDDFDWLILTSTNAVDYFFERMEAVTGERAFYSNIKIAVVGEKTAQRLSRTGIQPDFVPPNFVAEALVDYFPEPLGGLRVLFPRVESGGREVLVKEFTSLGAKVREVAAYESRCPAAIAPSALKALQTGIVDVITFASSKTVQHFCQLLQQVDADWQTWINGVSIASIGPQTSKSCQELLGRVDVEATEFTLDGLTQAIVAWATRPNTAPPENLEVVMDTTLDAPLDTIPDANLNMTLDATVMTEPVVPEPVVPEPATAPTTEPNAKAALNLEVVELEVRSPDVAAPEVRLPEVAGGETAIAATGETATGETAAEQGAIAAIPLIEVELVADSETVTPMETLQVELDSQPPEQMAAEADLIAEIQAVIQQGETKHFDQE